MSASIQPGGALLSLQDVHVERGGATVLNVPAFHLERNEVVSLIGPNGSGKTTLLLVLNGLLTPHTGRILHGGEALDSREKILRFRRSVTMVFHQPLLFDTTVYNNVATGLHFRGLPGSEIRSRVAESLERFHIPHLATRSARKLSGGEAQRTSLARAFVLRPELVLLDEPFTALDPPARQALIADLQTILRESSTTVVMATHAEAEALAISSRIAVLNQGSILQSGAPAELFRRPANEFVARFVAALGSASAPPPAP